jgi:hypothetical protein
VAASELEDTYRLLDLPPDAPIAEVKRAYRELAKVWHPDRFSHDPALRARAEEKLKQINAAYARIVSRAANDTNGMGTAFRAERDEKPRTTNPANKPDPRWKPRTAVLATALSFLVALLAVARLARHSAPGQLPTAGPTLEAKVQPPEVSDEVSSEAVRAISAFIESQGLSAKETEMMDESPRRYRLVNLGVGGKDVATLYTMNPNGSNGWEIYLALFSEDGRGHFRPVAHARVGGKGYRYVAFGPLLHDGYIELLTANYGKDDPMCCPSVAGKSYWAVEDGVLVEGSACVGRDCE